MVKANLNKTYLLIYQLIFGFSLIFSYSIEAIAENRIALVIGNAAYKIGPLKNPINDAKAMGDVLSQLDFDVTVKTNVNQVEFKIALTSFYKQLVNTNDVGLFFFAGHGIQLDGENYLVPIDAKIEQANNLVKEAIHLQEILKRMEQLNNSPNILILDACRNNPYVRSFRSMELGLASPGSVPAGSIIAFATAPGGVAADGKGINGLYTQELIKALSKKGRTVEQVFKEVRRNVSAKTKNKQVPWENSSLTGQFIFNKSTKVKMDFEATKSCEYLEDILVKAIKLNMSLYWVDTRKKYLEKNFQLLTGHTILGKHSVGYYVPEKALLIFTQGKYLFLDIELGKQEVVYGRIDQYKSVYWSNDRFIIAPDSESPYHARYYQINQWSGVQIGKFKYQELLEQAKVPIAIPVKSDGFENYFMCFGDYLITFNRKEKYSLYKITE